MIPEVVTNLFITTIPGALRISVSKGDVEAYNPEDIYVFDRPMSIRAKRILAVALLQSAEEDEINIRFQHSANS